MIPYLGNKSTISNFILPNCPKNPEYFIEPFGGMMGLYFSLNLKEYPDTKFVYNDINPLNSNLFTQMKKDKFIGSILDTKVDKDIFMMSYDNLSSGSKEDKALAWLIILVCSDMKDLMGKKFKGSPHFDILKYKLPRYTQYYKKLIVHNMDYKKLIKKYDEYNIFWYFDPPYVGYENYYTNHNFNSQSHIELYDQIKLLKGNWLLSYYNFPEMKDWYKDYKITSTKHNLGEEYLIIKS